MNEKPLSAPRIKICGLTSFENSLEVVNAGSDALGFNLWSGSKRFIDLASSCEWIARIPPFITRVAILVNPTADEVTATWESRCFDLLQLHGQESVEFCQDLRAQGIRFLKALSAADLAGGVLPTAFGAEGVLIDSAGPAGFGGTGETFEWKLVQGWERRFPGVPLILSGGLKPENVAAAVRAVRPWAVDTASGVELSPGIKSPEMVREFCQHARGAHCASGA